MLGGKFKENASYRCVSASVYNSSSDEADVDVLTKERKTGNCFVLYGKRVLEICDCSLCDVTNLSSYCQESTRTVVEVCRQGTSAVPTQLEPEDIYASQAHACPAFRPYPEVSHEQH